MAIKKYLLVNLVLLGGFFILPEIVLGKTVFQLFPNPRIISKRSVSQRSNSSISETSQQTGSASGFVNSTAQGNGQPGSAVAYAWQGGETSAQGSQTATADQNSNLNAQTTGTSNCQQGYLGSASGNNGNSVGNALCNATNTQTGTHQTNQKEKVDKEESDTKFGWFPQIHFQPPIHMNYSVGLIGEGTSGQTHNSASSVGGELGGLMSIFAGGFAGTPQGSATFSHSAFDNAGRPINANQSLAMTPTVGSEEHTLVDIGGPNVGHNSGGLAHAYQLGESFNSSYNSHAEEEEEKAGPIDLPQVA